MTKHEATVQTLTAEVRVLTYGTRQITKSVVAQLDAIRADAIQPFGRIRTGQKIAEPWGVPELPELELIGRHPRTGVLVKANVMSTDRPPNYFASLPSMPTKEDREQYTELVDEWKSLCLAWRALPLIVLAGAR